MERMLPALLELEVDAYLAMQDITRRLRSIGLDENTIDQLIVLRQTKVMSDISVLLHQLLERKNEAKDTPAPDTN